MSDRRSKRPLIVPVFISNQGCPHRCIFCQQEKITSQTSPRVDTKFIKIVLNSALKSKKFQSSNDREIAFYGGTFTRLPPTRIKELLNAINPYLEKGYFNSVRVSTRPDEINRERLEQIKELGVKTVELGAQSMDDIVLRLTERGHTSNDTVQSFHLLRQYGFKVGIQLMPGLPGDSKKRFLSTVEKIVRLRPDMVRLYPTIVIKGTKLAELYRIGEYTPLSIEEAIEICESSCLSLEEQGIPVIRMGLMSSPSLLKDGQILAGPWHSAFGFLVRSSMHHKRIETFLPKPGEASKIGLRAPMRTIPLIRGYKNNGFRMIEEKTGSRIQYLKPDDSISNDHLGVDLL